eukprot:gene97-136_t
MSDYFRQSSPLRKSALIEVFEEVKLLTLLIVAPFGLCSNTIEILGEFIATDEYSRIFRLWEEFLSRKIYASKGIPDDQVAASMSIYTQQLADKDVINTIRGCQEAVMSLLAPPNVVELPNVCTADAVATMMTNVVLALQILLGGLRQNNTSVANVDEQIASKFGLNVMKSLPVPVEATGTTNTMPSISLTIPTTTGNDSSIPTGYTSKDKVEQAFSTSLRTLKDAMVIPDADGSPIPISYDQYLALIEIHGSSIPVRQVVQSLGDAGAASSGRSIPLEAHEIRDDSYSMLPQDRRALDALRLGFVWDGLSQPSDSNNGFQFVFSAVPLVSVHPCVSLVNQIEWGWASSHRYNDNNSAEKEDGHPDVDIVSHSVKIALSLRSKGLEASGRTASMGEIEDAADTSAGGHGDPFEAMELFSSALAAVVDEQETDRDEDKDEEKEVEDDDISPNLPSYLLAQLLTDRAECCSRTGHRTQAIADCDAAIAICPRYGPAYACRAGLWTESDDDHDIDNDNDSKEEEVLDEKTKLLKKVSDVLAAFHLGGTSDVRLGALAEEAAREASRTEAKETFLSRDGSSSSFSSSIVPGGGGGDMPKEWLVRAYFVGYDLLSSALGIEEKDRRDDIPIVLLERDEGHKQHSYNHDHDYDANTLKEGDLDAYNLLCGIVGHLETVAWGVSSSSSGDVSGSNTVTSTSSLKEWDQETIVVPLTDVSGMKDALGCSLVCEGQLLKSDVEVEVSGEDHCEGAPSEPFLKALELLLQESATPLSGAKLRSTGRLEEVLLAGDKPGAAALRAVSTPLRARLLNVISAVVFLCGDSLGAETCLRASLSLDDSCEDTTVKLAALLSDMSEENEAIELLRQLDPNPVINLHLAEAEVVRNDFAHAVDLLINAKRSIGISTETLGDGSLEELSYDASAPMEKKVLLWRREKLAPAIKALLGIAIFRMSPNHPEEALSVLKKASLEHPRCENLQLCLGELAAQTGDVATSMTSFRKASFLCPSHPMPYLNAARTFLQLGFDLAQAEISAGSIEKGMALLDKALAHAKHVSEIRDVITARVIALAQLELEEKGICPRSGVKETEA